MTAVSVCCGARARGCPQQYNVATRPRSLVLHSPGSSKRCSHIDIGYSGCERAPTDNNHWRKLMRICRRKHQSIQAILSAHFMANLNFDEWQNIYIWIICKWLVLKQLQFVCGLQLQCHSMACIARSQLNRAYKMFEMKNHHHHHHFFFHFPRL